MCGDASSRRFTVVACCMTLGLMLDQASAEAPKTIGKVERLDPAFDQLLPPGTEIQVLASGFDWSEGPVWVPKTESLLFSDIPPNKIMSWNAKQGINLFRESSGYTGTAKIHRQRARHQWISTG